VPSQSQIQGEIPSPEKKIRCVLVHDHVLLRQGIRRILEDEPDLEVVAEAGTAAEALQRVFEYRPEVVLAGAGIFGLAPNDAERLIQRESAHSKILFLSMRPEDDSTVQTLRGDTVGCAPRHTSALELVEMVRKTHQSGRSDVREMPARSQDPWGPTESLSPRRSVLTAREREVLKLLAEGRTVRSAAGLLGLSLKTVDAHKFNLMRKLGIHNKAELVMWAIQKRVVKIPANF
jgi:two-component system response regulator NreC